ncbi:NAD(P)-dependent oxidoreductase [Cellulomonas sp. B6]|uniref:NAD-dependent epimerase/dehydratase family protein n=1 Tax=Cellulomonas sp. B6 TaxID=1295626 RepID=UPI00073B56AB|nr:NAD-dependent epimerase/dehydratase family protein [Cellulomonas sp. B6]KSW29274.1 NAD-dependent dehydratase [Cellulomonas sp. B6]
MSASGGTVLVTGGAGFIGCAMSAALVARYQRVVALDSLHPQVHPSRSRPAALASGVELRRGDVTEEAAWDELLRDVRPDVVVHLAAETGTGQSLTEATRHASVNVVGTTRMLDALVRHDALPRRVVLASSRAVYGEGVWRRADGTLFHPAQRTAATLGEGRWDFPDAEPTAMRADRVAPAPVSVYGATKLAQEHVLRSWARAVGVLPVVLRLQNVYGPGQSLANPYTGIVSLFCRLADAGRSIPLYEDGEVRRDFVLVDDVARALVAATTAPDPGDDAVDIGSGEHQTVGRVARLVAQRYGAPAPHVTGQFREGDVRHAWADAEVASRVLGWRAEHDLETGVGRLVDWIATQDLPPL